MGLGFCFVNRKNKITKNKASTCSYKHKDMASETTLSWQLCLCMVGSYWGLAFGVHFSPGIVVVHHADPVQSEFHDPGLDRAHPLDWEMLDEDYWHQALSWEVGNSRKESRHIEDPCPFKYNVASQDDVNQRLCEYKWEGYSQGSGAWSAPSYQTRLPKTPVITLML